jgi:hypothetical protein
LGRIDLLIGIDVGYSDTKDSNGNKFKSAYAKSDNSLNESKRLTINERDYFIGTGTMTSEVDKTGSDINMVCTIYDIILNNAKDIYMVVGLPIGQYNEQKDKLKESIIAYNKYPVIYNDKPYQFRIKDVIVCRQEDLWFSLSIFSSIAAIINGVNFVPCSSAKFLYSIFFPFGTLNLISSRFSFM